MKTAQVKQGKTKAAKAAVTWEHTATSNVVKAMQAAFKSSKPIGRKDLIAQLMKATKCGKGTVPNYIAVAKKSDKVLGFKLIEEKGKAGEAMLRKAK